MKSTDAPSKQAVPFGTNGPREAITATTPSGSNQASYDQGFPPITMTLKSAGGLPPKGQDMNQILFEQSSFNRYFAAGGGYVYDSTFSTAVGGYPLSARIPNSTGTGFWFNTVEDNQTNPENNTAALTGWIPMGSYGVTALTGLTSASVTLTTLQASKERITLAGALTANINIVVPAWIKRWEIVNNCTGAFTVTIKTPSGTGVAISSGVNQNVFGDGANVTLSLAPGTLIGAPIVLTSSGSYTPSPGTRKIKARGVGGGGAGGGTGASQSNSVRGGGGGGAGTYGEVWVSPVTGSISYSVGNAGAGVTGNDGSVGGVTSFGTYMTLPGGNGGAVGINLTSAGRGASGAAAAAAATGALISTRGQAGSDSLSISPTSIVAGAGAGSPLGQGAPTVCATSTTGTAFSNTGSNAMGYGSGGGGGTCGIAGAATAGGSGSPGILIIEEYA